MDNNDSIIEIDIGGRIFKTYKSTLMNSPYFNSMFSNNFIESNNEVNKKIFIDRNPDHFEWILEVLRTGEANGFEEKYIPDLEFFGIDFSELLINSLYDPIKNIDDLSVNSNDNNLCDIVLTKEQLNAQNIIFKFLKSNNNTTESQVCLLEGYAGVGKTTILSKILLEQNIIPYINIAICAPTHKAKNILESKLILSQLKDINNNINNNLKATTIHKLFGLSANINEDGKLMFKQVDNKYKYMIKKFKLIVIDECSMISEDLFEILLKVLREFPNIKMIITGDSCQLPPINEDISKTFSEFRNQPYSIKLKNVVRHEGGILDTATLVRKNLNKRYHKFIEYNDVRYVNDDKEFLDAICFTFVNNKKSHVITWTNKRTNFINSYVRNSLFGAISKDIDYLKNEQIIVTDYFDALCETPDDSLKMKYYTCDVINLFNVIIENTNIKININGSIIEDTIKCYKLYLTEKTWIYKVHKEANDKYEKYVKRLYRNAKIERNKRVRKLKWEQFHIFTKTYNAPINYNYSTTCHKAQGSTYSIVFVDLLDMYKNRDTIYMNKCIYTGITRTAKMLIMFL